jgi:hypothetical protein
VRRRSRAPLLILLLGIVGLLAVADVTARTVAQRELADRLRVAVPGATATAAEIHSFPFLPRLVLSGGVPQVDARVNGVTVRGLTFDVIQVDLDGVRLDRDQLIRDRRVVLEGIERGRVRAEVTADALSEAVGVPITLEDGRASVTIRGRQVGATLAVRENRLVVGGVGVSLPGLELVAPLLPCVADADVEPGRVVLTCEFTEVPRELLVSAPI